MIEAAGSESSSKNAGLDEMENLSTDNPLLFHNKDSIV